MDETTTTDPSVVCTDEQTLSDVAKSAADTLWELLRLLPAPIPTESRVYASLEAIRSIPLQAKANPSVGVQVDFINQEPANIIKEQNTSVEYEIIIITPDKHTDDENCSEIKTTDDVDNNDRPHDLNEAIIHKVFEMEQQIKENGSKLEEKLQDISCAGSKEDTDTEYDAETMSFKSSNSTLIIEDDSEVVNKTVTKTGLNDTLFASVENSNDPKNSNEISYIEIEPKIKIKSDKKQAIEETMNRNTSSQQQNPETMSNKENMPLNRKKCESLLNSVQPKDYKTETQQNLPIFVNKEDVIKCLNIASKAMSEHKYDKAKRMAEKAERIHPTSAARALLQQIRIVTEAKEEAAERVKENIKKQAVEKTTAAEAATEKTKTEIAKKLSGETKTEDLYLHYYVRNVLGTHHKGNLSIENGQETVGDCDPDQKPSKTVPDYLELREAVKKRRAVGCLALAMDAFSQGDLSKAKKLAEKALKLHPSDETNRFLTTIRNKLPENVSKVDTMSEAFTLIAQAKTEMKDNNMKRAEQLLLQSINIHETETANILLDEIRQHEVKLTNNEKQKYWLEMAKTAFKLKAFINAEMFLQKSIKVLPSTEAIELLEQVQTLLTGATSDALIRHAVNSITNPDVHKCIQIAINAISSDDLDKAEKFLKKAERIQSTEAARELLERVQQGIEDKRKSEQERNATEDKAASLVACAVKAISEEDYDVAEVILTNAWIRHKSLTAKQMLEQVKLITATDRDKAIDSILLSEKYVELAENMMSGSDAQLDNVEAILIVAHQIYPTKSAKDLLTHIRNITGVLYEIPDFITENEWYNAVRSNIENREAFRCNTYMQMAKKAFSSKDLHVGNRFLVEVKKLNPCEEIKKIAKLVDKEIKKKKKELKLRGNC